MRSEGLQLLGPVALGSLREIALPGAVVLAIAIASAVAGVGAWAVARFEFARCFACAGIIRAAVPVVSRNEEWIFSAMLPDAAHPTTIEELELVGIWTKGGNTILRSIPATLP